MEKILDYIDGRISDLIKYNPKDANARIAELLKVKQIVAEVEKEKKETND